MLSERRARTRDRGATGGASTSAGGGAGASVGIGTSNQVFVSRCQKLGCVPFCVVIVVLLSYRVCCVSIGGISLVVSPSRLWGYVAPSPVAPGGGQSHRPGPAYRAG